MIQPIITRHMLHFALLFLALCCSNLAFVIAPNGCHILRNILFIVLGQGINHIFLVIISMPISGCRLVVYNVTSRLGKPNTTDGTHGALTRMTKDSTPKKSLVHTCVGPKSYLPTRGRSQILSSGLSYVDLGIYFLIDCVQENRLLDELAYIAIIYNNT
jgi:hypothetical protein